MIEPELSALEPRPLWSIFFELCAIPHPSHKEAALAEALLRRAREAGLEASLDPAGNLIIKKKASPGLEGAPGLILQAHLDMVAQVEAGSGLDLERDPVLPRLDPGHPGWLSARGSTLGADDGLGVAAGLALLEDPELRHGPLELLLTVNEEDGMSGARGLEAGSLRGGLLLNLDGEDEREICVGCSGGLRLKARFRARLEAVPAGSARLSLELGGLSGGHSAQDIDKGRGNALILAARLLGAGLRKAPGLRLGRLEGGSAANAIPREALALLALPAAEEEAFRKALEAEAAAIAAELAESDPGFRFTLAPAASAAAIGAIADGAFASAAATALAPADSARLLACLAGAPLGLRAMSESFPDLVSLSSNLGVLAWLPAPGKAAGAGEGVGAGVRKGAGVAAAGAGVAAADAGKAAGAGAEAAGSREKAEGAVLEALILARGARDEEKLAYGEELRGYFEKCGAEIEVVSRYPAWTPELGSPLLRRARELYPAIYGREAQIKATHGGLECGLFRSAFPAWEMLSIGPNIERPHSPSERAEIASAGRFWLYLRALVEALARE